MIQGILVPILWISLGIFTIRFLFKAKTFQPLSLDDLALTWKLHKQKNKCKSKHIKELLRNKNEVIGFKCECGYEFKQERLITQDIHKPAFFNLKPSARKE